MYLIKPDYFSVLTRVFAVESRNILAVSIICGFKLDDPEKVLDEEAIWEVAGSALSRGEILDHGWPKPRGEYLAAGRCYVPGGGEAEAARVSIRFSQLSKTVYVFGDRRWTSPLHGINAISKPLPFKTMDMSWGRAFGGEAEGKNPAGVGLCPRYGEKGRETYLPNIEDPRHLIASPNDRPDPAGFGARGLDWAARLNRLGTFDDQWLREHWPAFPGDFDFGYFNMAPPDQQLDGYFRGGETFNIRGMHPDLPRITGSTPKMRARVFIQRGGKPDVSEIKTRQDTVWFFPDRLTGILVWRGRLPVGDDEAGDVARLGVFSEMLGQDPRPIEHYLELMTGVEEESAPEAEPIQVEPAPEAEPRPEPPAAESETDHNRLDEALGPIAAALQAVEEKINARLRGLGMDPETIPASPDLPPYLDASAPIRGTDPDDFLNNLAGRREALEGELDNLFKAAGFDPETMMDEPPDTDASIKNLEAIIKSVPNSHGELKDGLVAMQRDLKRGRDKIAEIMEKADDPQPVDADIPPGEETDEAPEAPDSGLAREDILSRYQRGEPLSNLDLSGLDLSGGTLTGADLSGSNLERTILAGADLSGADLQNAMVTDADLNSCHLVGAKLAGVSAVRTHLNAADLTGADMTGAELAGADMTAARLDRADLTGADLSGAKLKGAQGRNMIAAGAIMAEACLDEGDFSEADFTSADLDSSSVVKTVFKSCRLKGVSWTGVQGQGADFENADLTGARTNGPSDLSRARFVKADLTGSYWEETMFPEADFNHATLAGCTMTRCDLEKAVFSMADARAADFSKSDLTNVDARFLNLFEGSLRKACLDRADFCGANLSAVDFYQCRLNETKMERTRLNRTLFSVLKK